VLSNELTLAYMAASNSTRGNSHVTSIRNLLLPILFLSTGCASDVPAFESTQPDSPAEPGTTFDLTTCGRISGRVTWNGPIPTPQGFLYGVPRANGLGFEFRTAENPNRPRIDPHTRAVGDAVVFLRGVDPAASRPWDLPPVGVEMGQGTITIIQGERRGRVGFVRRGNAISASSNENVYHVLRGRGAAFFGLTLPEPKHPVSRTLAKPGRVELSSGTGLYWASADLFVADHPYYTITSADGQFAFERVPAGNVEVVIWMPSWQPARMERDPDSTQVARQSYGPPIERVMAATIDPSHAAEITLSVP
jgi:hypothetical protein